MTQSGRRGEHGQVLVLAAVMFSALLGFLALVVDVGAAYAQRRYMQSAADAASIAATRHLSQRMLAGTNDAAVVGVINGILSANNQATFTSGAGLSAAEGAWYLGPGGGRVASVGSGIAIAPVPAGGTPVVAGVEVAARRNVNTVFARIMGINTVNVTASASARYGQESAQVVQPPDGGPVMPIAFDLRTHEDAVGCLGYGAIQQNFARDIIEDFNCSERSGGFNWTPLHITSANANSVIDDLLDTNSQYRDTIVRLGDPIQVSPGSRAVDFRELRDNWQGQDVVVPLLANTAAAGCPNCTVPLAAFGWFHIVTTEDSGPVKSITGYWVDPRTKPPLPGRRLGSSSSIRGPVTFALTR